MNKKNFKADLNHIDDRYKKLQISKLIETHRNTFANNKFDVCRGCKKGAKKEIKLMRNEYVTSRAY